jgi:hypothetical protein
MSPEQSPGSAVEKIIYLTAEDILKADDRPIETVAVPEWGGSVRVRGLDGDGRDEYFASMTVLRQGPKGPRQGMNTKNATAKLVARCIVDEVGDVVFSPADVEALGKKSGAALDRVFSVAQRLSGLSDEDMEELGKASVTIQSEGSTSPSPGTLAVPSPSFSSGSLPAS